MHRREAIIKLANTFHLNVVERAQFVMSPITIAELAEAIRESVHVHGGYPSGWRLEQDYDGVYISANPSGYVATLKAETSLARFQVVEEKKFSEIVKVAEYVAAHMFPSGIGGMPGQW